jgi:hypothetical protein
MSAPSQHLLTLWNPSYTDEALDAHLRVLLDWASARALELLPRELTSVVEIRNASAHSEATPAGALEPVRNKVLGIGCEGLLERLVRVRMRSRD